MYKGYVKAERNFLTYALFVTFFPQLVAGPIERSKNLLPQFKVDHAFDYERVTNGIKRVAWGMFKKIAIADTLSLYVNAAYADTTTASGTALAAATVFFAFQIYCDFSGYTDAAIGLAEILGFHLMKNFDKPYLASSISEFWHRWHISLSTWFKDYIYIPLGGNRVCILRHYRNLLITFLVSGLWHGAALHFVAWGLLHGLYLIAEHVLQTAYKKLFPTHDPAQNGKKASCLVRSLVHTAKVLVVFCLVCAAWVFFRAESVMQAFTILKKIAHAPQELIGAAVGIANKSIVFDYEFLVQYSLGVSKVRIAINIVILLVFSGIEIRTQKMPLIKFLNRMPNTLRWSLYYAFAAVFFLFISASNQAKEFIYFQF